jgi:hypothetical protein
LTFLGTTIDNLSVDDRNKLNNRIRQQNAVYLSAFVTTSGNGMTTYYSYSYTGETEDAHRRIVDQHLAGDSHIYDRAKHCELKRVVIKKTYPNGGPR